MDNGLNYIFNIRKSIYWQRVKWRRLQGGHVTIILVPLGHLHANVSALGNLHAQCGTLPLVASIGVNYTKGRSNNLWVEAEGKRNQSEDDFVWKASTEKLAMLLLFLFAKFGIGRNIVNEKLAMLLLWFWHLQKHSKWDRGKTISRFVNNLTTSVGFNYKLLETACMVWCVAQACI